MYQVIQQILHIINKSNNFNFDTDDKHDNEHYKNFTNTRHSETLKEKNKDDVLRVERTTLLSVDNENQAPKSSLFQSLIFSDNFI